jgi:hypothetical protein
MKLITLDLDKWITLLPREGVSGLLANASDWMYIHSWPGRQRPTNIGVEGWTGTLPQRLWMRNLSAALAALAFRNYRRVLPHLAYRRTIRRANAAQV